MNFAALAARLDEVVAALNVLEQQHQFADIVTWKARKKFVAIDFGTSGTFLVEKTTGELFNIKSYGVADYNKKQKANIGNIFSVDPAVLYRKRYNYLRR